MGRVIFVTSFKGGVGKTTVTAALASVLSAMGKSVLIIDGDFGMRCMDLVLGAENNGVFDCSDVLAGSCSADDAIIKAGSSSASVDFLPAPMRYDTGRNAPDAEKVCALCKTLKEKYDFVFIDSSAECTPVYTAFAAAADSAIVVTFHQSTAIRAAEKTAIELQKYGFSNIRIIINAYHDKEAKKGVLPDPFMIVMRAGIKLLGIVPYDINVIRDQESGKTALCGCEGRKLRPYEVAFVNIAKRMCGEKVPLLGDVFKPKKASAYGLIKPVEK